MAGIRIPKMAGEQAKTALHREGREIYRKQRPAMSKPVVGVIGNTYVVENRFPAQMVGERNLRAVAEVTGALPLMFAGTPEITDIGALLDTVDGILLTGARANVHPTRFGLEEHPKYEPYDHHRDALPLELVEA